MNTVEIILELLKSQNKKQKELTQFLGISETSVADWKRGKTESYKKHIGKISEFFGVSTDYLLGTEEIPVKEKFKVTELFAGAGGFAQDLNKPATFIEQTPVRIIGSFNNPAVDKAYQGLSEKEKLEVQIFILEKAAASEKSNATIKILNEGSNSDI